MIENKINGTMEITSDPSKLVTWPNISTTICPQKLDKVAPKPKKDAVKPTVWLLLLLLHEKEFRKKEEALVNYSQQTSNNKTQQEKEKEQQ